MTAKEEDVGRPTARDLLEEAGGEEHALHTVVSRSRASGKIVLTCSCGQVFKVSASKENSIAVRNVPERGAA